MAFVLDLPSDLDRALAVMAAQRDTSKANIAVKAIAHYVYNYMVVDDDSSSDSD